MSPAELFLASDAALRDVFDRLSPADLDRSGPAAMSEAADPTVRDLLAAHAYDEAWVPDVLAGRSIADGDEFRDRDLLGDDPIASYGELNDAATAAVGAGVPDDAVFRFQYGDYPASEGLLHLAMYRAVSAWAIANHLGVAYHLPPDVVTGLDEHVVPTADQWREFGVFPPEVEPPADADDETRVLAALGYDRNRA